MLNQRTHYQRTQDDAIRRAMIDSIKLEQARKRVPKSRAGRLLMVIRDIHVAEAKHTLKVAKTYDATRVDVVAKLNERIERMLAAEDKGKQTKLF